MSCIEEYACWSTSLGMILMFNIWHCSERYRKTTNRRAGVNLIRHTCLHNAHKLAMYTRQWWECYITLFDMDGRKFNYVEYREGMIGKVLDLIWFVGGFFKRYTLLCNAWHNPLNPFYHCPSGRFSVRCNEAFFFPHCFMMKSKSKHTYKRHIFMAWF